MHSESENSPISGDASARKAGERRDLGETKGRSLSGSLLSMSAVLKRKRR